MDIQDAIQAPRIHAGSDWTTSDETIMIETRIDKNVIEGLESHGAPGPGNRRLDGLSMRTGCRDPAGRNAPGGADPGVTEKLWDIERIGGRVRNGQRP